MPHEQLWAPWRLAFVKQASDNVAEHGDDCFLCRYSEADASADAEHYVVRRTDDLLVVLNRFPYNNGHLLVAPRAHKACLSELTETEMLELMRSIQVMTAALGKVLNPDGFNVGLNLGRVAGAGLPGHLHWHIVPRWNGDTNFMAVICETDVIPQSLDALYELLITELSGNAELD
jgi:ATP adenylyltransferase